ncbi:GDP-mannose 4,6 dehydratase [Rhodococcus sp. 06-156-3C]|nr:GDP-mannose 4,6 dehydratase [Rhodococcus sp. 06-156-4C]OZD21373.1 GDP-mannose 4,6 dehydratase [Rhodococcus sp. 06-156-4a]OZD24080.1 GDP-mannose 4,6 dehydratase [Rhodococcus sp. 06-156-3b]OZD25253.1 GDP-mannose 4,6 dehydratase [Rhodococcus sp. 06-156-3C]OZD40197.1 GDP-mannose 4,6 dehydratase [Rhodococcus sp. 06-156-3]OZF66710.1 GDP-mannose 4,6 dehydratase [Rhodococcus sp. 06-156-4]
MEAEGRVPRTGADDGPQRHQRKLLENGVRLSKKALITGVTGQDGTYLSQQLLADGWDVWGTVQPSTPATNTLPDGHAIPVELSDPSTCKAVVARVEPDVIFHFAGISSVAYSWDNPVETALVNGISVVSLAEELLQLQERTGTVRRLVNASSAEIFAGSGKSPQNEQTRIVPTSPYGTSKAFSHHMVQVFRTRGLHASNAIFYNHESPQRPTRFVTRKITAAAAAIADGRQSSLELGNLDARRDWGWAPDYAHAARLIAAHADAGDYVIATGEAHSVRDFVDAAFRAAGIADWSPLVSSSDAYQRPTDSAEMVGDASKAHRVLGWRPTKTFNDVVAAMVQHDIALLADR